MVLAVCYKLLGIRKIQTTSLHPQSDAVVEKFNKIQVRELTKYCINGQSAWIKRLLVLLMA